MKKSMLLATCLTVSLLGVSGGVNSASAKTASMSVAAADDDETGGNTKDDVTAGDDTNKATFSWSGTTLTVTGKGDLSKITVTDENIKVFSAAGAGKVYTKTTTGSGENATTTSTAVKQGDSYNASTSYYEPTITYGDAMTPKTDYNQNYSMSSTWNVTLNEGESIHACYFNNGNVIITTNSQPDNITSNKPWDWDNKADNTESTYYKYCIVKGTCPTEAQTTVALAFFTDGVYTTDSYTVTLLTDANRGSYAESKNIIKASVDNLFYSTDATNYTSLAKDATVEYTEGMKLYVATVTVGDEAIADNATYFGTTHSNYLEAAELSFADYLPLAVGTTYSTVIFKSEDKNDYAQINNAITRALVKISTITKLNLKETYLPEIKAHEPWQNSGEPDYKATEDPTFFLGTLGDYNGSYNSSLKTLYMPKTDTKTLSRAVQGNSGSIYTVFYFMGGITDLHLGEGIETIGEYCFAETGNKGEKMHLATIVFPNTLKKVEKHAFDSQDSIQTFTFPVGFEEIEAAAFESANPKDVYFLDTNAPKVAKNAWGSNSYISNNSLKLTAATTGTTGHEVEVKLENGVATRNTYMTQNGWMTMLHYPAACTQAQAARYTDITRKYKKIVYGNPNKDADLQEITEDNGVKKTWYKPGKETTTLKGSTNITGTLEAPKEFNNEYPGGTYGGDYNGGYDDIFVGSQYTWPSMSMAQRATIVAENNKLWDGTTSIAEGITKAGDTDYSGDGKEYIGLHQFVFAQADVTQTKTDEWDMTKYADGKWHSICMPFNITKAEMKDIFGDYNMRLCKFNRVLRVTGNDNPRLKLYFNDEQFEKANDGDTILLAHVSYMIKAEKKKATEDETLTAAMTDYEMVAGSPIPTNIIADDGTTATVAETNPYYFIGNYISGVKVPQYSYFFSKNKAMFRFAGSANTKWNAYSSVVIAPNGADDNTAFFQDDDSQAKTSTLYVEDGDNGSTTGIDRVTIIADDEVVYTNDNVYNLNGQLVSTRGMNGLSKGIYIQNGKKYIVK